MCDVQGRWFGLVRSFLVTILVVGCAARATDADDRLDQIEKQVRLLSQSIYNAPSAASANHHPTEGPVKPPSDAVSHEIRLAGLEDQVRELTGDFEEITHTISVLKADAARQSSDLEVRLNEITASIEALKAEIDALKANRDKDRKAKVNTTEDTQPKAQPASAETPLAKPDKTQKTPLNQAKTSASAAASPPATAAPAPAPTSAGAVNVLEVVDAAKDLIKAGKIKEGRARLQAVIDLRPQPKRVGKAYYWLGETYAKAGDLDQAMALFAEGYEKNPKSPDAGDLLFKLAQGFEKQGRRDDACITVQALLTRPKLNESLKQAAAKQIKRLGCGR